MSSEDTRQPERENTGISFGDLKREDADRYLPLMEDFQMSEAQKLEFLGVIWNILAHFVEMGFDLSKVDICGQLLDGFNEIAEDGCESVTSGPAIDTETKTDQGERHD